MTTEQWDRFYLWLYVVLTVVFTGVACHSLTNESSTIPFVILAAIWGAAGRNELLHDRLRKNQEELKQASEA